jgi:hypothetical protein
VYLKRVPGVRIPLSPQSQNNPASGGIVYFTKVLKKACFLKGLKVKETKPGGLFWLCKGATEGITTERSEVVIPV